MHRQENISTDRTKLAADAQVLQGDSDMLDILLRAGARPQQKTSRGRSAMDLAQAESSKPLLELLDAACEAV